MPSRESEIAAILQADAGLDTILTGGVYTYGELTPEGISRDATPAAFDSDGFLLPIALVKQRGHVPDGNVADYAPGEQVASSIVIVEIWLYERITFAAIDAAQSRIYTLLQGTFLANSFELTLANVIDRQREAGALQDASMARMDWAVYSILQPI